MLCIYFPPNMPWPIRKDTISNGGTFTPLLHVKVNKATRQRRSKTCQYTQDRIREPWAIHSNLKRTPHCFFCPELDRLHCQYIHTVCAQLSPLFTSCLALPPLPLSLLQRFRDLDDVNRARSWDQPTLVDPRRHPGTNSTRDTRPLQQHYKSRSHDGHMTTA